jgi:hypothetical protein
MLLLPKGAGDSEEAAARARRDRHQQPDPCESSLEVLTCEVLPVGACNQAQSGRFKLGNESLLNLKTF